MPAEWEPHEATWIGWPHNRSDWPGKFAAIPWVFGEIVRKIAAGETVRIIVESKAHEAKARRLLSRVGVDLSRVDFFRFPTDRGWTRDFGPIFVRRERPKREVAVAGFGFNAWARYPNWRKDAGVAARAAKALGVKFLPVRFRGRRVVLEGGAIDVNGRGTLIATEECLLDPEVQVRNPGMSRKGMEEVFRAFLGVTNVIWLGKGIAGDDTHGHVDDLCRFAGPRTVVLCRERNPKDENHRVLEENRERLADRPAGGRFPARGRRAADARAAALRRDPAAGQLRQLLHLQRRRPRPHLQRPERPDRPGHPLRAVPGPAGGRDPRRGSRVGVRHAPLPDAAAAGVGVETAVE